MSPTKIKAVPIGECVEPIQTWNPGRDSDDDTFRYIDISSVSQDEKRITVNGEIPTSEAPSRARQLVCADDVLVSTVRPNLNAVAFVPDEIEGATASTGFCVLRPDQNRLSGRYLFHWVQSPSFVADMVKQATGQSYPAVSDKIVKQSKIPLPPLDEQKRIAAILDQADALRRLRQRAFDRLNELGQAVFYEMFGDPVSNSKGWPIRKFETLARNEDGRRIPVKLADREDMGGEFPYYGASGIIDFVDNFIFEGTHLLIGEDGANLIARSSPVAFMADGKFWVNNHAHVLSYNNEADLRYLEFFIESIDLKKYVSGSAQPKLTQKNLNNIEVPYPPIDKQQEFSSRIREIEQAMSSLRRSITLFELLFASFQHRAFRGDL
ncbi:MAG: restriction endonuclease subunit S [Hyphomicrobiales bacterium]|nr:restriction endonuclease subunit S [Hyphomicrobiales bacterium]